MAAIKTLNGEKLLVQIGDGAGPEVFTHDCLINTERGIAFAAETGEFIVPDCTNPGDPAWKEVTKDGLSGQITGAGMLHTSSIETWWNWWKGADTKNIHVKVDAAGADGGGYWAGAFHLTAMEVSGNRKEKATVNVTLMSSGALTWTDAA